VLSEWEKQYRVDAKAALRKQTKRKGRTMVDGQAICKTPEWLALRQEVIDRDAVNGETFCVYCGKKCLGQERHIDHIKPKSKFPDLALIIENLQILCKACNFRKAAHY